MKIDELKARFGELYGTDGEIRVFFAPGRVNLIGEHIDYNGGYVFPCAINFGTYGVARKRNDSKIRLASLNFDLKVECDSTNLFYDEKDDWANYLKGVVKVFQDNGYKTGGFDALIYGNIPNGAGLSSSASVELLTSVIVNGLFNDENIDMIEMIKMSQTAENKFVGVNCGIMDQFAIGKGKKEHAILLDCHTLNYKYAPLVLGDYRLVITNSNKRRGLAESKYNERREECDSSLEKLQTRLSIKSLCEMTPELFETNKELIGDEIKIKRVRHAVYENQRTLDAVEKLNLGDIEGFGKLLNESHISLRDDYEVTGKELDALVEEQWKAEGVAGARMTGAGFGGCTVAIVKKDCVEKFITSVSEGYLSRTGLKAEFYVVEVGNGAGELK